MEIQLLGQGYEKESENSVGNHLIKLLSDKEFQSFTAMSAFISQAPEINSQLHLRQIRAEWDNFYNRFPAGMTPTRKQVLDHATHIDNLFGALFTPPIRPL